MNTRKFGLVGLVAGALVVCGAAAAVAVPVATTDAVVARPVTVSSIGLELPIAPLGATAAHAPTVGCGIFTAGQQSAA